MALSATAFRILNVEEKSADTFGLDQPEHREIDIDDVLVPGEHQALLGNVAHGGAAADVFDQPHADIDLVDAQRLWGERRFDRVR
jgi:hypothetical protein